MSPYLLANSFQVDFYALYRAVSTQKEKSKKERQLAEKQKELEILKKSKQDAVKMRKIEKDIREIELELRKMDEESGENNDQMENFLKSGVSDN